MKIISTNLSKLETISWRGRVVKTGIYKYPVNHPIFLDYEDVRDDVVHDRKHHGGLDKACYLFARKHYHYWKNLYPNQDWEYGMFGENLTVEGLDETVLHIGDIYNVGEATITISKPRQPCYKLGVKFGTQAILKQFIDHGFPGTYVSIIKPGFSINESRVLFVNV